MISPMLFPRIYVFPEAYALTEWCLAGTFAPYEIFRDRGRFNGEGRMPPGLAGGALQRT
jgi:hypothetical protein